MDIFSSRAKEIDGRFRSIREKPTGLASQLAPSAMGLRLAGYRIMASWVQNSTNILLLAVYLDGLRFGRLGARECISASNG